MLLGCCKILRIYRLEHVNECHMCILFVCVMRKLVIEKFGRKIIIPACTVDESIVSVGIAPFSFVYPRCYFAQT